MGLPQWYGIASGTEHVTIQLKPDQSRSTLAAAAYELQIRGHHFNPLFKSTVLYPPNGSEFWLSLSCDSEIVEIKSENSRS